MSEADLVAPWPWATTGPPRRAVAAADADFVVHLFDELRRPLARYLLSLGLSAPDADEVIQEVFLALFQHLGRGKSRAATCERPARAPF